MKSILKSFAVQQHHANRKQNTSTTRGSLMCRKIDLLQSAKLTSFTIKLSLKLLQKLLRKHRKINLKIWVLYLGDNSQQLAAYHARSGSVQISYGRIAELVLTAGSDERTQRSSAGRSNQGRSTTSGKRSDSLVTRKEKIPVPAVASYLSGKSVRLAFARPWFDPRRSCVVFRFFVSSSG